MKQRFGTILLLGTYLLVSLQVVFHVHACQKSGVSVQLYTETEMSCCAEQTHEQPSCCEMAQRCERPAERASCCASEQIKLGFDQPQQLTEALALDFTPPEALVTALLTLHDELEPVAPATWPIEPPPPKVAPWRWHCAALTYG